jgi:hypothetical protein
MLQWNPTATNQENDTAYAADSQRVGGAPNGSLAPSATLNKVYFQASTYLTGLFAAFAAKGFTTSDSNLSTLTAQCANFLTTADVLPNVAITAYAASLTLNAAAANGFYITAMTGNLTIVAINGLSSGQLVAMYYQQDATGGRTVTYPGNVVGAAQPDPAPNAVSLQLFGYDFTTSQLRAFGPLVSNNGAWFPNSLYAPTQVSTDNSTKVATTAWAKFGFSASLGANGYFQFPTWLGGFMVQWFSRSLQNYGSGTVLTFPTAFPNNCFAVWGTDTGYPTAIPYTVGAHPVSGSQYSLSTNQLVTVQVIAIGN